MPSKSVFRALKIGVSTAIVVALSVAIFMTRERWLPLLTKPNVAASVSPEPPAPIDEPKVLRLSTEARKNLGLTSQPVVLQDYWRTIQIPGIIVDRPGFSDNAITSPIVGVVAEVHALAGDTVKPGDKLFTLRLSSEYLQNTQVELLKAERETQLIQEERRRVGRLVERGVLPGKRMIELDQQLRRQEGLIQAYRQGLSKRGIDASQLSEIAQGTFVDTIDVLAPSPRRTAPADGALADVDIAFEVQELKVDVGQQVEAGTLLSVLSNHALLYIEGHAFKQESGLLETSAQNSWPVDVEFAEDDGRNWPSIEQTFQIRHLGNKIDSVSRTFDFYLALTNPSRTYEKDGKTFVVWRFRPGQRARLFVPVEQFKDVIVLSTGAVIREGPEAYVFRQNGDLFNRIPVHVLYEDRVNVVIADDGDVTPGMYLAQGSAASLNRVLKAQAASGVRADVHVHADGTVHGSH